MYLLHGQPKTHLSCIYLILLHTVLSRLTRQDEGEADNLILATLQAATALALTLKEVPGLTSYRQPPSPVTLGSQLCP